MAKRSCKVFILLFLFVNALQAQIPPYDRYEIGYDVKKKTSTLYDNVKDTTYELRVSYPRRNARFIHTHFVEVKSSDMKCLFNLEGRQILRNSQYIFYFPERSLITAYETASGNWFVLNFEGDTLAYDRASSHRTRLHLREKINVVPGGGSYNGVRYILQWGCLNNKGHWIFPAQAEEKPIIGSAYSRFKLFSQDFLLPNKKLLSGELNQVFENAEQLIQMGAIPLKPQVKKENKKIQPPKAKKPIQFTKEQKASFPGGTEALKKHFEKHFNKEVDAHPEKRKIFALVINIAKNGQWTVLNVLKGVDAKFDREMMRLLEMTGKWEAAVCAGTEPLEGGGYDLRICPSQLRLVCILTPDLEWGFIIHEP